jgi:hypothetical protein
MSVPQFVPREGGVKIVFDVPEDAVDGVVAEIAAAGFVVGRYYTRETEHRSGGSEPGWIRLGAAQPMRDFTEAEQHRIVAAFDAASQALAIPCRRMGTDGWTAGGGDDGATDDREPHRRAPTPGSSTAKQ